LWLDDYPYSHSLFALIVWGALFGSLYKAKTGDKRAGLVIALLVVSHWVLDFVTHRPDIQLYPGGAKLGLGRWNWSAATVIVERLWLHHIIQHLDDLLHLLERVVAMWRKPNRAFAQAAHHARPLHPVIRLGRFRRRDAENRRAMPLIERRADAHAVLLRPPHH